MTFDIFAELRRAGAILVDGCGRADFLDDPISCAQHATRVMFAALHIDPDSDHPMVKSIFHTVSCDNVVCGLWAACGFPTVTMGHRTAAELMATKIGPDEARDYVRAPWPAFAIRVPSPLLAIMDEDIERDAPLVLAACLPPMDDNLPSEGRWWYKLYSSSPRAPKDAEQYPEGMRAAMCNISLFGFNMPTSYLAEIDPRAIHPSSYERWDTHETTSVDQRSDLLTRALIVGCSLQLAGDPRERAEGFSVRQRESKQRRGETLPPFTTYELQSSIKINLHHAMRDYVQHGGRAPSVRSLVAGHWKRQVHGEKRSLRKLIHVRPYWRGDVNAPVSERTK